MGPLQPGSAAAAAGLVPNDVIVAIDGQDAAKISTDSRHKLVEHEPGDEIEVTIQRGEEKLDANG